LSIYTKIGDGGKTTLQDGIPIPKHHPIVIALAALDELNAHLGVVKSQPAHTESAAEYGHIQKNIMTAMSLLSATSEKRPRVRHSTGAYSSQAKSNTDGDWGKYFAGETGILESKIDATASAIPPSKSFVTYGACPGSATLDLARAVARRAETCLTLAAEKSEYIQVALPYINRLSDFLYIKARYADFEYTVMRAVRDVLNEADAGKLPRYTPASRQSPTLLNEVNTFNELTLAQAKTLLEKIESNAEAMNLPITTVCCNAAGNPIAAHVMDNSLIISYEAAMAKAFTAASLKMPTLALSKLVQPGQPFYGLESLGGGKIIPIGGGVPIFGQDSRLIGAIGVSGGTAEQDHELASSVLY